MYIKNGSFRKFTHIIAYVSPVIVIQPVGGKKKPGDSFNFYIKIKGSAPLVYQWYKNSFPLLGEITDTLLLSSIRDTDDATYFCIVGNNKTKIKSNVVKLDVIESPYLVTQPLSVLSEAGSNITFNISSIGTEPLIYKWFKNNILISGSSNTLYINNIYYNNEGKYYATVTNTFGSVTSNEAELKILNTIKINTQPINVISAIGDNVFINLSCTGVFPITAEWRKNKINYTTLIIEDTGFVELSVLNVSLSDIGYYDCILSNIFLSVTSNKAYLYVNEKPVFTLQPVSAIRSIGQGVTFVANTSGTKPITYQWTKIGTGNILNKTSRTLSIDPVALSDQQYYACIATNVAGSTTSLQAYLSVVGQETIISTDIPDYEYILLDTDTYWKS